MQKTVEIDIPVEYAFFGTAKRSRSADWRTARTTIKASVRVFDRNEASGWTSVDEASLLSEEHGRQSSPLPVFGGVAFARVGRRERETLGAQTIPVDERSYAEILTRFREAPSLGLSLDPFGFTAATQIESFLNAEWKRKLVFDSNSVGEVFESNLEKKTAIAVRAAEKMAFVEGILHTSRYETVAQSNRNLERLVWNTARIDTMAPAATLAAMGMSSFVRWDKLGAVIPQFDTKRGASDTSGRHYVFRDFDHNVAGALHRFLSNIHPLSGGRALVEAYSPNWPGLSDDLEEAVFACRKILKRTIDTFADPVATATLREASFDALSKAAAAVSRLPASKLVDGNLAARDQLVAQLRQQEERWLNVDCNWQDQPAVFQASDPMDDGVISGFSM
jgi:hypothetical protein